METKRKRWIAGALALLLLLGLLAWQLWLREDEPSLADPAGHIPLIKLPLDEAVYWDSEKRGPIIETLLKYRLQCYDMLGGTPEEIMATKRWHSEYTMDFLRRVVEGQPAVLRRKMMEEGDISIYEVRYDAETQQIYTLVDSRRGTKRFTRHWWTRNTYDYVGLSYIRSGNCMVHGAGELYSEFYTEYEEVLNEYIEVLKNRGLLYVKVY